MNNPPIYENVLPGQLANCFEQLKEELEWEAMWHGGKPVSRLVAIQSEFYQDDPYILGLGGKAGQIYYPLYRHPTDYFIEPKPFSPTVKAILEQVREKFGLSINHVKIQLYPNGDSFISPHSDKTIDIKEGSRIINLSLGATRTMQITDKKTQTSNNLPLKNNSAIILDWETNQTKLHGVKKDTRLAQEKSPDELLYGGARISMVFRTIDTFYTPDSDEVIGQGKRFQSRENTPEILRIFSIQNREGETED